MCEDQQDVQFWDDDMRLLGFCAVCVFFQGVLNVALSSGRVQRAAQGHGVVGKRYDPMYNPYRDFHTRAGYSHGDDGSGGMASRVPDGGLVPIHMVPYQ